ncbi:natural cytotoxicity triggering receptor 3 ligand 1 isoform X1 [Python bivittatus]|uniref:Natural cytotoxicity triggering receptor 3 ligand 1 isoform X1 n=1 Tax=Python bivittatus TaxID=176946 RepID=A0A9F5N1F2_PYTBI|nr:natural cytotoxicity triggering receptor 3 ligand 1 isoform X1 [Python bivittatus]XP_025024473.1 natural cytotoxicity triggering receptor 3 ligand 1 isoform X1 [Python bivittatus]XP_025024474.1 natural cytotoxicity triggering receptor 3 ligand 1 isoform X1 [Python bivittatus]
MATHFGLRLRKLRGYVRLNCQESSAIRRRLCLFFSFLACLGGVPRPAESLEVSMSRQKTAELGANVILLCEISGYPGPELDINKTAVIWYLKTSEEGKIETLYSVIAGDHYSNRTGSRLDTVQLKNGNASLFLPQIQINEEGKYICFVTVTPVKAEGATILDLVAQPSVKLSPKELQIEKDKEKTLSCIVNQFYPNSIVILWQKHSKHTLDKSVSAEDICTETSVRNGDGTFNITSKLRLQPSSQDQGNVYSCTVEHKSFVRYPVYNVTLTVTEPKLIAEVIIGIVACLLLIVIGYLLYKTFLKKSPPSLEIVGNEELKHLEETQLQCLISHFRPKLLHITLFLVTQTQSTKQKIASWCSTSFDDPEEGSENFPLLGNLEDMFRFYPELKSKPKGYSDIHCKICINPNIQKLEKFDLLLEVKHKGFQRGLCTKTKSFKVIALPLLREVQCSTNVPRPDEPLTLSCKIHSYFPETLEVCWYKNDEILDSPFTSPPTKGPDGLFFCISKVQYCPQVADSGKRFVCRAKLEGSQEYKESAWQMNTLVLAPKVCKMECKPPVPECGKSITLTCSLTEYHPPECDFCWRKGFEQLTNVTLKTEEPQLNRTSKLYSRTSEITFTPSAEDHEVDFSVEINHYNKILRKGYTVMLKGFPKVSNIVIEPSDVDYGETITLTCDITDFHPKNICTQWFLGDNSIRNGAITKGPEMASNDCFKLTSVLQLRATASVCDKAICFRVTHTKLKKAITREVYLKLPAKRPVVSEIKATLAHKSILLEISISQFAPHDIQVRWYQGWKQISENINPSNIDIGEDHLCYFVSKIHLEPKAIDFGKTIRCEVKHPTSTEEKSLILNSRDFSGFLEETQHHL